MPCFHSAEGGEVPVLWAADQGEYSGEEAVPAVRRVGLQDDSAGGGATGTEEGAEDHCVRGVREASVAAAVLRLAGCSGEKAENDQGFFDAADFVVFGRFWRVIVRRI